MIREREQLRSYIASNVLTVGQAAQLLKVTRRHVTHLIRTNVLSPILQEGTVSLFLKQDIIDYADSSTAKSNVLNNVIFDFEGTQMWQRLEADKKFLKDVVYVAVYFNDFGAAQDGYYYARDDYYGPLQNIDTPTLVIKKADGREIWTRAGNCGYGGNGPHQTAHILREAGFKEEDIRPIFESPKVQIVRDQHGNVDVFAEPKQPYTSGDLQLNASANLYAYQGHLVLAQSSRYMSDSVETLRMFRDFLPNPIEMRIYTQEQAQKEGYVVPGTDPVGPTVNIYRVFIQDASGREIWLSPHHRDAKNRLDLYTIHTMRDILSICGFEVPEERDQWFHQFLRVIAPSSTEPIVLSKKD